MSSSEEYRDSFIALMGYIRELAESEETDLKSEYSRGRASGIHSVLLLIDTVLVAADIDRAEVGLENLTAESWYGGG